jgi:minor extracellular serine protease Vpr
VAIPAVMVSLTDGAAIFGQATTAATSPVTATLDVGLDPTKDDRIAAFSSRGPGHDGSGFKPDLSAPGLAIVSTGRGSGTGAATIQGTSMASPHVAGAAALLRQEHPHVPPYVIKSLLQNSTVNGNASGDTSLARHGVGAVRVDTASTLTSFALPGGVSFGRLNPTAAVSRSETVVLENWTGATRRLRSRTCCRDLIPAHTRLSLVGARSGRIRASLRFDLRASADAGI